MFDLFRSRAKAVRILLGVMLGMVALSMLVYLIPGAGTTTAADQSDQVVADIGKDVLTLHDVELGIQNARAGRARVSMANPLTRGNLTVLRATRSHSSARILAMPVHSTRTKSPRGISSGR